MEPRCWNCGAILDTPCECLHEQWLYEEEWKRSHFEVTFDDAGEIQVAPAPPPPPNLTVKRLLEAQQRLEAEKRKRELLFGELYGSFSKPPPEPQPRTLTERFVERVASAGEPF